MALTKVQEEMIQVGKSLTLGGRTFDSSEITRFESGTTGVILYGQVGTAGRWATLRKSGASAGFQVPVGKTLTVKAIVATTSTGGGTAGAALLYGDTDVGQEAAAAPTTPIYLGGISSTPVYLGNTYANANNQYKDAASVVDFQVPAQKYLAVKSMAVTSSFVAYCFID